MKFLLGVTMGVTMGVVCFISAIAAFIAGLALGFKAFSDNSRYASKKKTPVDSPDAVQYRGMDADKPPTTTETPAT